MNIREILRSYPKVLESIPKSVYCEESFDFVCKTIKDNTQNILEKMSNGKKFSLLKLRDNMTINGLKFKAFHDEGHKDEGYKDKNNEQIFKEDASFIYFSKYKSMNFVLKIRLMGRNNRIVDYFDSISDSLDNFEYPQKNYLLDTRRLSTDIITYDMIKLIRNQAVFIIVQPYKGISLEKFKTLILQNDNIDEDIKKDILKIILINFTKFMAMLNNRYLYLTDQKFRNLGLTDNLEITILDEEMVHVRLCNHKSRHIELLTLFNNISNGLFYKIKQSVNPARNLLKSYFNELFNIDIKTQWDDLLDGLSSLIKCKKRKREEKNEPRKKRKIDEPFYFNPFDFLNNDNDMLNNLKNLTFDFENQKVCMQFK